MLEGKQLVKSIGGRKIVESADVSLAPGEIAVIVGPSGSGKTTLLKLMALLDLPDSGSVTVNGEQYFPAQKNKFAPPWPRVTVVFQQLFLWPHLTLLENIKLPLMLRSDWKGGSERRQAVPGYANNGGDLRRLDDLIDLFAMGDFINRYPNQASLGQRQRAALVRALVLQPEYLLLDEITSSLDVEQIAIILQYLKSLANKGIGILIVTHLLNFARDAADKVIFMDGGQIIESGGKEVLNNPSHERVRKFLSLIQSAS